MHPLVFELLIEIYLLVIALTLICVLNCFRRRIRDGRPELAAANSIAEEILVILVVLLGRAFVIDSLYLILDDDSVVHWIIIGLGVSMYLLVIPCVCNIMNTVAPYCSRLRNKVTTALEKIGAKKPDGYSIFKYKRDIEIGFCNGDCPICLIEYELKDKCALLDNCAHTFHLECLHSWLLESNACPLCRQSIRDCAPPPNKEVELLVIATDEPRL